MSGEDHGWERTRRLGVTRGSYHILWMGKDQAEAAGVTVSRAEEYTGTGKDDKY